MALYSRTSHPFSPVPESHAGKLEAVRLHLQQQMVHRHLHHPVSQQEGPVRGEDQKVLSHRLLSRIHWSVRINISFRCGFSLTIALALSRFLSLSVCLLAYAPVCLCIFLFVSLSSLLQMLGETDTSSDGCSLIVFCDQETYLVDNMNYFCFCCEVLWGSGASECQTEGTTVWQWSQVYVCACCQTLPVRHSKVYNACLPCLGVYSNK